MVKSFRDLLVWQKAMNLADAIYTLTASFPRTEMFGLTSQIRRAAVSIPANIAEGRAVGGGRFLHHIRIALGSEAELETEIELSVRLKYLTTDQAKRILESAAEVARMLHGLHSALAARRARMRVAAATATLLAIYASTVFLIPVPFLIAAPCPLLIADCRLLVAVQTKGAMLTCIAPFVRSRSSARSRRG